jgi:hypothetical protein
VRNFFQVEPTPEDGPPPPPDVFTRLPYPTLDDLDQTDTQQVRAGLEYVLIAGPVKIPLRAGFFVDRQYFRAADGSPPWFHGYTAGTGVSVGPLLIDVAFVHEQGRFLPMDDPAPVRTQFSRVFVSLTYRAGS